MFFQWDSLSDSPELLRVGHSVSKSFGSEAGQTPSWGETDLQITRECLREFTSQNNKITKHIVSATNHSKTQKRHPPSHQPKKSRVTGFIGYLSKFVHSTGAALRSQEPGWQLGSLLQGASCHIHRRPSWATEKASFVSRRALFMSLTPCLIILRCF